jgi:hypothetical protein
LSALESIGELVPDGWFWQANGFYDNHIPMNVPYADDEVVTFQEFQKRMHVAAIQNAYKQTAVRSSDNLEQQRDAENCFRVVELGIKDGAEVVVLATPMMKNGGQDVNYEKVLTFVAPKQQASYDDPQFRFRILKGHTVENLIKHRNGSTWAYFGFAVMGVITVVVGVDMITNGAVHSYG